MKNGFSGFSAQAVILITLAVASAIATVLAAVPNDASAQDVLEYCQSVRSWGMGTIGAADDSDPANAFFNPAIIASNPGAFLTSRYGCTFSLDSGYPRIYQVGAGLVARKTLSEGRAIKYGGGVSYATIDWGDIHYCSGPDWWDCPLVRPKESTVVTTLGAEVEFNSPISLGAGVSIKPWRYRSGEGTDYSATAIDWGLLLKACIIDEENAKLSANLGTGFLNLGDKYGPEGHEADQPRTFRYGLGMRYEGATSECFHNRFGVDVPVFSAVIDYELAQDRRDYSYERGRAWGVGAELSVLRVLYLRTGFFKDEYGTERDGMLGFGLGWTFKRGWCRFDLASYPDYWRDQDIFLYGLSAGLAL